MTLGDFQSEKALIALRYILEMMYNYYEYFSQCDHFNIDMKNLDWN